MTLGPMRWFLGLDLRDRCQGPLQLARWIVERSGGSSGSSGAHKIHAAHVLEQDQMNLLASVERTDEAPALARKAIAETIEKAQATSAVESTELALTGTPDAVLSKLATNADGLLIGRQAPRGTDSLIRLGRVARRLLRSLPTAVVVSPPDLGYDEIGAGPVILATEADAFSQGAARFATRVAKAFDRPLLLFHVVPMPHGWSVGYLDADTVEEVRRDLIAAGERKLERWATEHGLQGHQGVVVDGVVPDEVSQLAKDQDACIVVCGSRKLSAVTRLFVDSVGSELAARGRCPVAVVPEDYGK